MTFAPTFLARGLCAALMLLASPWANALVFAVNEGVTYRVPLEEVRGRYAVIAADLSKLLKQPVTIEPVGDYNLLRRGLQSKAYDIAMIAKAARRTLNTSRRGYR